MARANSYTYLLKDKKPTPLLSQILHSTHIDPSLPLEKLVEITQKEWLRKPGLERWHIQEEPLTPNDPLMHIFKDLGLVESLYPSQSEYKYLLFMGAGVDDMARQYNFLKSLIENGLKFNSLVALSGERYLDPVEESPEKVVQFLECSLTCAQDIKTEFDALKYLIQTGSLQSSHHIHWINAPAHFDGQGTLKRPTTADTLSCWIKTYAPYPTQTLILSNQPFVLYQQLVTQRILGTSWKIDAAGYQVSEPLSRAHYLDTLARILYEYHQAPKA